MKIAFIGVGGITRSYRQSLKQLEHPIAAVCDINAERAAAIAAEENATAYTDHDEMLQKEKPDVVFICIPPGAHTTQVADAAASGAALFVAKPVAQDLETAQRTREAINTDWCPQSSRLYGAIQRHHRKSEGVSRGSETCHGNWTVSHADGCQPSMVGEIRRVPRTNGGTDDPRF